MTRNPELTEETAHEITKYVEDVSTLTGDQKGFVESMSATQYWNIFGRCRYPLLYGFAKSLNVSVRNILFLFEHFWVLC